MTKKEIGDRLTEIEAMLHDLGHRLLVFGGPRTKPVSFF